jgi:hypothetical protein
VCAKERRRMVLVKTSKMTRRAKGAIAAPKSISKPTNAPKTGSKSNPMNENLNH